MHSISHTSLEHDVQTGLRVHFGTLYLGSHECKFEMNLKCTGMLYKYSNTRAWVFRYLIIAAMRTFITIICRRRSIYKERHCNECVVNRANMHRYPQMVWITIHHNIQAEYCFYLLYYLNGNLCRHTNVSGQGFENN